MLLLGSLGGDRHSSLLSVADGHFRDQDFCLLAERLSLYPDNGLDQALGQLPALVPGEDTFEQPDVDDWYLSSHLPTGSGVGGEEFPDVASGFVVLMFLVVASAVEAGLQLAVVVALAHGLLVYGR